MGERHDADHPVAQARERLSEVGMGERREAAHSAAEARERLGAIAEELARRASPQYVRGAALNRTKERLTGTPWILGVAGGAAGAMVGKYFADRARERKRARASEEPQDYEDYRGYAQYGGNWDRGSWDRPYDEYTATHEPGEGPLITRDPAFGGDMHQAVGLGSAGGRQGESERWRRPPQDGVGPLGQDEQGGPRLSDRARQMASQVRERIPQVRGYVPSRDELRRHTDSLRHTTEEHPTLWMIAALAAGSFFASVMPLTESERRMLGQAKARAQTGIDGLKHQAFGQLEGLKQTAKTAAVEMMGEMARNRGRGAPPRQERPMGSQPPQQQQQGGGWQPDGNDPSSSRIHKYGPGGSSVGGSYHAGGTNEDERRQQGGWSPPPDPNDVTRH
jgi:hypothetical protein